MSASSKKKLRKEQNLAAMTERQKNEQKEAKKLKIMTISFVSVIVAIALVFGVMQIVGAVNRSGVNEKNTIALTVGDEKLNTVTMNYYFFDALNNEYTNMQQTYGNNTSLYYSAMGLDLSKPLNSQVLDATTGETWADYYWDIAVTNAQSDYALLAQAKEENYQLSEDTKATIDTQMRYLSLYAYQYGDVESYLRAMYGQGSTEESYYEYLTNSMTAYSFYNDHAASLEYDDASIRAYEKDRYDDFNAYSFASYYVNYTSFLPKEITSTNATEEQKEAARKEAEKVANSLTNVSTVKDLDIAIGALEINKDLTTKPTSTLNENTMHSSLKEEYAKWMSAADRKEGDVTVFPNESTSTDADGKETKVVNGYYVMMFTGKTENLEPLSNVRHLLVSFTGGTTDSNGNTTYSEEDKNKAKTEAQGYLDEYLKGDKTEESFIELVKKNSDDGSASTGGLFEDIHRDSNFVTNFKNWAIDPDRKAGDTGLVESEYGYHVMYYVGDDELTYRDYLISNILRSEDVTEWHTDLVEAHPTTDGNLKYVNLDLKFFAS